MVHEAGVAPTGAAYTLCVVRVPLTVQACVKLVSENGSPGTVKLALGARAGDDRRP